MAEQTASTALAPADMPTDSGPDAKFSAQAHQLSAFLKQYSPSSIESPRDTLEGKWHIDLATPLPEFDTKTARAYAASNPAEPHKKLYALVCRPGTYQRHRIIPALKTLNHPNVVSLVAAGAVELSQPQEERFVIIYERPAGKKISQLLAETKGQFNENFLSKNIITPLAAAIHQLSQLDIAHGRINPDNIYFDTGPMLGDCVSEPCGYSQPYYFEPLERMQALAAGKGEGASTQDYYALAVLVLYLQHGAAHFDGLTQEVLIRRILRDGGYNALMRDKPNSDTLDEFFRGSLTHSIKDRWHYGHIKSWLDGKRFNVLVAPPPAEAVRPFEFHGMQAVNRRELAHGFYLHWPQVAEIINNGQLTQWVAVSLRNKEIAESVARIARSVKDISAKNDIQLHEQLMRLLLLFDPTGPLRISPLSMHLDGIDSLCAELFAGKAEKELQLLAKFIEYNMSSYWFDHQRSIPDYVVPLPVNNIMMRLERLRVCIRNAGMGFGLERMLYELNPEMPCLSPLLANAHIVTLPALLKRLDRLAPAMANTHDPIDRHIAAFIASRVNIQHEIRLHELNVMPALAGSQAILALKFLAMAQQKSTDSPLPGLAHWLAARILPAMRGLRSRSLRAKLVAMFPERAASGSLPYMANLIIDSNYATADVDGFGRGMRTYHDNAAQIVSLRKGEFLDEKSDRLGFAIARLLAVAVLLLTLLAMVRDIGS